MTLDWNLDGRVMVNWRSCDWQPFPDRRNLAWYPIRDASLPRNGFYLLNIPPDEPAPRFSSTVREEYIVLDGSLVDSDGLELVAGDFASYGPGTIHHAETPSGCTLLAYMTSGCVGREDPVKLADARKVANWKTADFEPYPGLPETGNPLMWHDIRGNPATAEGFYIVYFSPGATSAAHEHTGYEEFTILDGNLTDSDGTTYRTGDCVSLPPGSIHSSWTEAGCVTAGMINGPFRTLAEDVTLPSSPNS